MNTCCDKREGIIDAECLYAEGRFRMHRLPGCLPSVFTVRFIAPTDFTAGDVVTVNNIDMPVKTPGMTDAGDGLFSAGAVLHCEIDLDRGLAFINSGFAPASGPVPPPILCYHNYVSVHIETDGDDDAGDGSAEKPIRSVHGLFALLGRNYSGYIKNLRVYLGRGKFDAPRNWFTRDLPFTVENAYFYGKNTEDNNSNATIIGDAGMYAYLDGGLGRLQIRDISFHCSDDSAASVVEGGGSHFRMTLGGICNIVNTGSVKKRGIYVSSDTHIVLGIAGAPATLTFKGGFTDVMCCTAHGVWTIDTDCKMIFDGSSTNLMYMTGCSSLYSFVTVAPEFRNGFRGNIRARAGGTIAIIGLQPGALLPTGSQWMKDDTGRITGQ